jgi:hypothetical protein
MHAEQRELAGATCLVRYGWCMVASHRRVFCFRGLWLAVLAHSFACTSALRSTDATFSAPTKVGLTFAAYLKAPVPQVDARFGAPVKVHPTGIAAAAAFEDVELPSGEMVQNGGAVYVFDPANLFAPPLRFVAPNVDPNDGIVPMVVRPLPFPQIGDWSGLWMELDAERLVIGVPGEDSAVAGDGVNVAQAWLDNSAAEAGAVYVYDRSDPDVLLQYIKAPNAEAGDLFGEVLALSGSWLAVGASGEDSADSENFRDNAAADSGALYMYEQQKDGAFVFRHYLKAPTIQAGDRFGANVAFDGDFMVVGAPVEAGRSGAESGADYPATGAIYVYQHEGDAWKFTARIAPTLTRSPSLFGAVLSFDDGRVAVGVPGAPCQESAHAVVGTAYVVSQGEPDRWSSEACISSARPSLYGFGISILGRHLLIGAPWDASTNPYDRTDASLAFVGAAYLYERDARGTWVEQAYIKAPNLDGADVFGLSVGMAPGLLVIGADQESGSQSGPGADLDDNGAHYAGAAYVFTSDDLTE